MNKIKEARVSTGKTRKKIAELIGMLYRTLQDWELDKSYPPNYIERLIIKEIISFKDEK
jgi:DNA-binding transcriptional regulator YiaG